ncbi:MAG: hypothetical protein ACTHNZ_05135 [Trinickia sp.]|uniref:hypothetical protein n=1 Tax=Trinickia sp. TaxID=2571163 RepID=UPI003F7EA2A7
MHVAAATKISTFPMLRCWPRGRELPSSIAAIYFIYRGGWNACGCQEILKIEQEKTDFLVIPLPWRWHCAQAADRLAALGAVFVCRFEACRGEPLKEILTPESADSTREAPALGH